MRLVLLVRAGAGFSEQPLAKCCHHGPVIALSGVGQVAAAAGRELDSERCHQPLASQVVAAVAVVAFNASPGSGVSARAAGRRVILTMHPRLVCLSWLVNAVLDSGRGLLCALGWAASKSAV